MLRAFNIAILSLVLAIGAIAKSAAEMPAEGPMSAASASIHSDVNHRTVRHSRESGNPGRSWIPGQVRNDKQNRTYVVMYKDGRSASLEFLRQQFGESIRFQAFLDFNKILQGKAWERLTPTLNDLVITGFERIGGFSNDELRQILSSLYADTFLRNSLGGIRYISHSQPGTAASVRDVGYIQMNVFNDPDDGAREMTKERALYLIQHELGHANDWNYSRLFSPAERLEMLAEVTGRFLQPGHFVGYHERQHVVYDRRNPHDNFYQTVREYWADLAREYVRSPDALRVHHPQDYELAGKWIRRLSGEAGPIDLARR